MQAESSAGDVEHNVASAARWVEKAAAAGAQLVVLPELFIPGYDPETLRTEPDRCDVTPDDARLTPLSDAARTVGVTSSSEPRSAAADDVRLLAVLAFGPSGDVRTAYAKQHLWDAERGIFTPGEHGATLVLEGWDLGLGICYDGCFPEHARAATDAGRSSTSALRRTSSAASTAATCTTPLGRSTTASGWCSPGWWVAAETWSSTVGRRCTTHRAAQSTA